MMAAVTVRAIAVPRANRFIISYSRVSFKKRSGRRGRMLGRLDVSVGNASVCPSGRLDFLVEKASVCPSGRLDNREHGLRPHLQESDFPTALLPVADIWIGVDADGAPAPNGLLIERKSAADLEASILDGRYREQRSRLMNYATERRAHPVYIIEGSLNGHKRLAAPALTPCPGT